ncbi:MAG: sensor histidine kinase [Bacillota bacterium]
MKNSMQKIFIRKFTLFIVIPILLLLGIWSPFFIYEIKKDATQNINLLIENYTAALEQEIENGSLKMSQFLSMNEFQVLDMMSRYHFHEAEHTYEYYKMLESQFTQLTIPNMGVDGMLFYFENGEVYNYKTLADVSVEKIKQSPWYVEAHEKSDRVIVGTEKAIDFIPNLNVKEKQELLFVFAPYLHDPLDQLDIVIMFQESVTFETLNSLEVTDYSAYIVNADDDILVQSDDRYITKLGNVEEIGFDLVNIYEKRKIKQTDWELILIMNQSQILWEYGKSIFVIMFLVIAIFMVFTFFLRDFFRSIVNPVENLSRKMEDFDLETSSMEIDTHAPYEIQYIQGEFNEMLVRINTLVQENQEKEYARHVEELRALQMQINPHFLSNTLNTIKFMAEVSKHEGIRKMTESLMQISDSSFRSPSTFHTVDAEIETISSYIYIMKVRYADGFSVEIDVENGCRAYEIPKLIVQPFLENSLLHGLDDTLDDYRIRISVAEIGECINITIEDNGRGIPPEKLQELKAVAQENCGKIGIVNVTKRLSLCYGEEFVFSIESEVNVGTKIVLSIPKEKK